VSLPSIVIVRLMLDGIHGVLGLLDLLKVWVAHTQIVVASHLRGNRLH